MRLPRHSIVLFVLLAVCTPPAAHAQSTSSATFRVFVRGADTGIEEVTILESPDGWTLRGSGKHRAPLNLAIDYWEARYDRAWNPIELGVSLVDKSMPWSVITTFTPTGASSNITRSGKTEQRTHEVPAGAVAMPNLVFGAYEALAARLASASPGSTVPTFIAPQDVVTTTVKAVADETIQVPGRTIAARRWQLQMEHGTAALPLELWTEGPRFLRLEIPSQSLTVVRDDIASVSARVVTLARPNDEQASIAANGFNLAATVSLPPGAAAPSPKARNAARLPAIVLISGTSPTDRDEVVAGIPVFAQLANALADAGFLVVRYDERGAGQSGGRSESATLEEFAADVRSVVTYLSKRRDVDQKRISLVGYGEGGWVALLVAAREQKVGAVVAIGTPSATGAELVLEQQRLHFEKTNTSEPARQAAVEQQRKILDAVITGKGWENLTLDVRRRVDTPLYRSYLLFDPAQAVAKVRQPLLVVQPMLDGEVPPHHGERLAELARARKRGATAHVPLAGTNHLLARASTGDVSEYATLAERSIAGEAPKEIAAWLSTTLPPAAPR